MRYLYFGGIMNRFIAFYLFLMAGSFCFLDAGKRKRDAREEEPEAALSLKRKEPISTGAFGCLPVEMLGEISGFLPLQSLALFSETNRRLRSELASKGVWPFQQRRALLSQMVDSLSSIEREEALVFAAMKGEAELVSLLLCKEVDLFTPQIIARLKTGDPFYNHLRAIDWATIYGNVEVVRVIVDYELRLLRRLSDKREGLREFHRGIISMEVERERSFTSQLPGLFFLYTKDFAVANGRRRDLSVERRDCYKEIKALLNEALAEKNRVMDCFFLLRLYLPSVPTLERQNAVIECSRELLYKGALSPVRNIDGCYVPVRSIDQIISEKRVSVAADAVAGEEEMDFEL
jgi:hypothetical protein